VDVASGAALAAGGFTTAFLAHIIGRHYYEAVVRPALLTAMLGYTFEVVPFVEAVMDECKLCRQQRLRDVGLSVKDQEHSYYLLDSPVIKRRRRSGETRRPVPPVVAPRAHLRCSHGRL
jgi:hypothetical protein